jgi:hypothetical protein
VPPLQDKDQCMKHSVWGLLALRVDGRSANIGAAREHVAVQAGGQGTPAVLAGRRSAGAASTAQTCLYRPVGALWGEDAASTAQSDTRVLPTHLS